jgi:uncharacterized protein (TIGR02453 family)
MGTLTRHFSAFFKELAGNNNREWFNANKDRFEEHVKAPFEKLTSDVITLMKKLDPQIMVEAKDCVFRIYRDTRFSNDKTPYKTHMSAVVGRGGRKDHSYHGVYYQIGVDGVAIAGGCWEPDKDRLTRIRAVIAANPKRVRKILDNKKFKETFGNLGGDKNKIIPKEFQKASQLVPEIYNKSFHYWTVYKAQKDVQRDDLAKFIVDHYKVAKEFNEFLVESL